MAHIFMDYNATTPIDKEVIEEINFSLINHWFNPSSSYHDGKAVKEVIELARRRTAKMIKAEPTDIIFTSGGTESNNMVLNSFVTSMYENGGLCIIPHIVISVIEHDSILSHARALARQNKISLTEVGICHDTGKVNVAELIKSLRLDTRLVSVMLANNETGIIQPIKNISMLLRIYCEENNLEHPILLHTDAAQALGKIDVSVIDLDVDYLTIVGHKFYGPRIGALYVRGLGNNNRIPLIKPLLFGGGQENGYRSGTENTPMIAGLGKASEMVTKNLHNYQANMLRLREMLETSLLSRFGDKFGCRILSNFHSSTNSNLSDEKDDDRLPNTCSVALCTKYDVTGPKLLSQCQRLRASVGSACHSSSVVGLCSGITNGITDNTYSGSSVLLSCGISSQEARCAIRLSLGRDSTVSDVRDAVDDLYSAATALCCDTYNS